MLNYHDRQIGVEIFDLDEFQKCGYVSDVFFAAKRIAIGIVILHLDASQKCGYVSDVFSRRGGSRSGS